MKTLKYTCVIWSDSSHEREYQFNSQSAMKAAELFGRCEGGEVVQIQANDGHVISEVRWTPEGSGKYYRTKNFRGVRSHGRRIKMIDTISFKEACKGLTPEEMAKKFIEMCGAKRYENTSGIFFNFTE